MNRRTFELLFGAASAAVGLAVALYTAVIATEEPDKKTDADHDTGRNEHD